MAWPHRTHAYRLAAFVGMYVAPAGFFLLPKPASANSIARYRAAYIIIYTRACELVGNKARLTCMASRSLRTQPARTRARQNGAARMVRASNGLLVDKVVTVAGNYNQNKKIKHSEKECRARKRIDNLK